MHCKPVLAPLFVHSRCILVRIRGVFFATLESRAEAHTAAAAEDAADVEAAAVGDHAPRGVRIELRRRPVAAREALT